MLGLGLILKMDGVTIEKRWLSVSYYTDSNGSPPFEGEMRSGYFTRPGVAACGMTYFEERAGVLLYGRDLLCLDTGGSITDQHLDVWIDGSPEAARQLGRHREQAIIIREGNSGPENRGERVLYRSAAR